MKLKFEIAVMPAKAGIQCFCILLTWTPACAGVTPSIIFRPNPSNFWRVGLACRVTMLACSSDEGRHTIIKRIDTRQQDARIGLARGQRVYSAGDVEQGLRGTDSQDGLGYFEEEAVISYTRYLTEIDAGRAPNIAAPPIAIRYWKLADDATLRDAVLVVRAVEAHHRDVNHGFADELSGRPADPAPAAAYPEHADTTR